MEGEVLSRGYLDIRGALIPNWRRREVELRPGRLDIVNRYSFELYDAWDMPDGLILVLADRGGKGPACHLLRTGRGPNPPHAPKFPEVEKAVHMRPVTVPLFSSLRAPLQRHLAVAGITPDDCSTGEGRMVAETFERLVRGDFEYHAFANLTNRFARRRRCFEACRVVLTWRGMPRGVRGIIARLIYSSRDDRTIWGREDDAKDDAALPELLHACLSLRKATPLSDPTQVQLYSAATLRPEQEEQNHLFSAKCLLAALNYLHGLNIVFGSIGRGNVMIDAAGHVKLIASSTASNVGRPEKRAHWLNSNMQYISAHRAAGAPLALSDDVWAVAVFLRHVAYGRDGWRFPVCRLLDSLLGRVELPGKFPILNDFLRLVLVPYTTRAPSAAEVLDSEPIQSCQLDRLVLD